MATKKQASVPATKPAPIATAVSFGWSLPMFSPILPAAPAPAPAPALPEPDTIEGWAARIMGADAAVAKALAAAQEIAKQARGVHRAFAAWLIQQHKAGGGSGRFWEGAEGRKTLSKYRAALQSKDCSNPSVYSDRLAKKYGPEEWNRLEREAAKEEGREPVLLSTGDTRPLQERLQERLAGILLDADAVTGLEPDKVPAGADVDALAAVAEALREIVDRKILARVEKERAAAKAKAKTITASPVPVPIASEVTAKGQAEKAAAKKAAAKKDDAGDAPALM